MKKIAILFVMMFAVALWFGSTVNAGGPPPPPNPTDSGVVDDADTDSKCPSANNRSTEIDNIQATSNGTSIIVTVNFIDAVDDNNNNPKKRMVKYRVHIDHRLPEPVGDEDTQPYPGNHVFTADADCDNSDSGVMYRLHKNTGKRVFGPGTVVESETQLVYTIPYDGLRNALDQDPVDTDDTVHIWLDVQDSKGGGICDRAPDTDTDTCDGSDKPDEPSEVISIKLT